MKKIFIQTISFTVGLLLFVGISIIYAWTEPPYGGVCTDPPCPPGGNVLAPINISSVSQYKSGALGVGGVFHGYSTGIFDGNVGIGTTGPWSRLHVGNNVSTGNIITIMDANAAGYAPTLGFTSSWNNTGKYFAKVQALTESGGAGHLTFHTKINDNNPATDATERMRIRYDGNVGIGTASPSQKLDVAGYVKGQTGLCIGSDCRNAWPGGSSVLTTFSGGRSNLADNETQTNVSGSLTAPALGILTLDYDILMESNYCGIIVKTYVDSVKVMEENVQGCYGAIWDATYDGSHGCGGRPPGQARTYKTSVAAGLHSFFITVWTGPSGGGCNSRGVQIKPAFFQWQP